MIFTSIDPARDEVVAEYEGFTDAQIEISLRNATAAFELNRARKISERTHLLEKVADRLDAKREEYARLMTIEMGKPIAQSRAEVSKCALVCRFYAANAYAMLAPTKVVVELGTAQVRCEPLGPILAVMPWNFPFWQVFRFAAPALALGNSCLLKHASNVPGSALAIEEVFKAAGFNSNEFQTLLVRSDSVASLIRDRRVAGVTLTGSELAGSSVGSVAGASIKPVVLELGGSDPFIVTSSANVEESIVAAVSARTINNGQSCIAAKRFIVHSSIYERFVEQLGIRFSRLKVGDPLEEDVEIGPLARESFANEIVDQVKRTVSAGARLVTGGKRLERIGFFVEPTVIADVKPEMVAFAEETFGPVATVTRFETIHEAISLANCTKFGLAASIWTNDREEADRAIAGIEAGSVFVNKIVLSDPRLPFGGIKASGVGRELARAGMLEFSNQKSVWRIGV